MKRIMLMCLVALHTSQLHPINIKNIVASIAHAFSKPNVDQTCSKHFKALMQSTDAVSAQDTEIQNLLTALQKRINNEKIFNTIVDSFGDCAQKLKAFCNLPCFSPDVQLEYAPALTNPTLLQNLTGLNQTQPTQAQKLYFVAYSAGSSIPQELQVTKQVLENLKARIPDPVIYKKVIIQLAQDQDLLNTLIEQQIARNQQPKIVQPATTSPFISTKAVVSIVAVTAIVCAAAYYYWKHYQHTKNTKTKKTVPAIDPIKDTITPPVVVCSTSTQTAINHAVSKFDTFIATHKNHGVNLQLAQRIKQAGFTSQDIQNSNVLNVQQKQLMQNYIRQVHTQRRRN